MKRKGGVGGELFVEGEVDFLLAYADDLGAVEEAVEDDVVDLAGFGTEDASEMDGLIAGEGCGGGGPGVGDEATVGHVFEFSWYRHMERRGTGANRATIWRKSRHYEQTDDRELLG